MMPIRSGPLNAVVLFELEAWLDNMKLYNEKQYGKQRILDLRNRILSSCLTDDRCDGVEVVREPCSVWTPPEGCSIFWMYTEATERGGMNSSAGFTWDKPTRGFFTFFKDHSDD